MRNLLLLTLLLLLPTACTAGTGPLVPSSVDTAVFDGCYRLDPQASFAPLYHQMEASQEVEEVALLEDILAFEIDQYQDFTIEGGVIRSGGSLRQEFSLASAEVEEGTLQGKAVWHEDVGDPGDASEVLVALRLEGERLRFYVYENPGEMGEAVILVRAGCVVESRETTD